MKRNLKIWFALSALLMAIGAAGATAIAIAAGEPPAPPQHSDAGSMAEPDDDWMAFDGMDGGGGGGMGDEHMMMGRMHGMLGQLDLSDAQRTKLADIHDRQARKSIQSRADIQIARLDLAKLIRADKPDMRQIDAQVDKVASLTASLRKSQIAALLEGRAVLTPDQLKKLREMRGGGMRGGMRHGPGHRMGSDGPPDGGAPGGGGMGQ